VWVSRNNFAAGKGVESDVRQVQGCLACFSWTTWQILPASGCFQDGAGFKSRKDAFTMDLLRISCLYQEF